MNVLQHIISEIFLVAALCMGLWVLRIPSTASSDEKTTHAFYIRDETESVDLPCGEFSNDVIGIEWFLYKSNQLIKILKFYHTTPGSSPKYYNGYSAENYGISESAKTSLTVPSTHYYFTGCG